MRACSASPFHLCNRYFYRPAIHLRNPGGRLPPASTLPKKFYKQNGGDGLPRHPVIGEGPTVILWLGVRMLPRAVSGLRGRVTVVCRKLMKKIGKFRVFELKNNEFPDSHQTKSILQSAWKALRTFGFWVFKWSSSKRAELRQNFHDQQQEPFMECVLSYQRFHKVLKYITPY